MPRFNLTAVLYIAWSDQVQRTYASSTAARLAVGLAVELADEVRRTYQKKIAVYLTIYPLVKICAPMPVRLNPFWGLGVE
jgi:hypothetical protein